jgi:molybdate transport system regulatory protein
MAKNQSVQLWIKLSLPGEGEVGPGKIELLRQIRAHESISAAARAMNMSYRRAWLLVDELNHLFSRPLVAKWVGGKSRGGASLTKFGEKLIGSYDTVVAQSERANRALLNELWRSASRGDD